MDTSYYDGHIIVYDGYIIVYDGYIVVYNVSIVLWSTLRMNHSLLKKASYCEANQCHSKKYDGFN